VSIWSTTAAAKSAPGMVERFGAEPLRDAPSTNRGAPRADGSELKLPTS
jgi:hypothetical protein